MTRFSRLRSVVEGASDLDGAERAAFLDRECDSDAEFRAEVVSILHAAESTPNFLEPGAPGILSKDWKGFTCEPAADSRVGGYRLIRRIAAGGMGTIWEAEQDEPRRRVAIKTLRFGLATGDAARRFRYEAEILARLQHPNIAQVYTSGVYESGSGEDRFPWYAMEFVEGAKTIVEFARAKSADEGLRLFVTLCNAVQHGHQRGVIHRDLKPGNVLVGGDGRLKVIDFGVARLVDERGKQKTWSVDTSAGSLLGTLAYMSPEQIGGRSDGIDTRSDVYALGVILFELLTNELPFNFPDTTILDAARALEQSNPPRPSERRPSIPGELDSIVLKALEHDRERRYSTAAALAEDVERYLRGESVLAEPPSVRYQIRVFARRHRVLMMSAALIATMLAVSTFVSLTFAWRAGDAEQVAVAGKEAYREIAYAANIAAAHGALRNLDVVSARARLELCPIDLRGFEWMHLFARLDRSLVTRPVENEKISAIVWHPSAPYLFLSSRDGKIEQRDSTTGLLVRNIATVPSGIIDLAIANDGRWIAAASDDGRLRVFSGEQYTTIIETRAHDAGLESISRSRDGLWLATSGKDHRVKLWQTSDWSCVGELAPVNGRVETIAMSPDGRFVAGGGSLGHIYLWDAKSRELLWTHQGHAGFVSQVAFRPDSSMFASAGYDHYVKTWDLAHPTERSSLAGHQAEVISLGFDATGRTLASVGWDRIIHIWDVEKNVIAHSLLGHESNINVVAFSPNGSRLATGDYSGRMKLWDPETDDVVVWNEPYRGNLNIRFSPDGSRILTTRFGRARVRSIKNTTDVKELNAASRGWIAGDFSPDGASVALVKADGTIMIFDAASGETKLVFETGARAVRCLVWDRKRDAIVLGGSDGMLTFVEPATGRIRDRRRHDGAIVMISICYNTGDLAVGEASGACALIHGSSSGIPDTVIQSGAPTRAVAASADGTLVAIGLTDGRVRLWSSASGQFVRDLIGHTHSVQCLAFNRDGSRLASGSLDRSVRIWDTRRGIEVMTLSEHFNSVGSVVFSADDRYLASASDDGTLRLWDGGSASKTETDSRPSHDLYEQACEAWLLAGNFGAGRDALLNARRLATAGLGSPAVRPLALLALGAADLRLGSNQSAIDVLEESLKMQSNNKGRALRALALARLGRRGECQSELAELQRIRESFVYDPFGTLIDEIETALGER